jgi:hypothetical protein
MSATNKKFEIVNGDISDGYHTFDELYEHRVVLYIAFCKSIQRFRYHGDKRNHYGDELIVWKSLLHSDGKGFTGWFIMGVGKEKGQQITYHLPLRFWNDCEFAETINKAPEWDGHTSSDVLERLLKYEI